MDNLDEAIQLPEDFDSRVRLFPLSDLVVFPHAMQPLHVFEPRYCEMLAESLTGDQLIAMATLTGGISVAAQTPPPIASDVCICRIISHTELEDDRHNILLVGIRRARIVQEIDAGRSFRIAQVSVNDDVYPPSTADGRIELKKELLQCFAGIIPPSNNVQQNLHELMAGHLGLGPITDIISYTLPFEPAAKLRLLGESDVDRRARLLVELLSEKKLGLQSALVEQSMQSSEAEEDASHFPPRFSIN